MNDDSFIHLCQPAGGKSCGACCGLYNYADSSRDSLAARIRARTRRFHAAVKGTNDLPSFAAITRECEDQTKRYEVIYCCEYLGFLDQGESRVGCLLHPLQNDGLDMRDVSFYGRELCDGHFCPSYHYLTKEEKLSLIYIIDDWYLYGLCVTDIDLVKEWFRLIASMIYEVPPPERFRRGKLREISSRFFSRKISWPFRSEAANRLGKYYFDGSQYMINHIDYDSLGRERSRFDKIFLSLSSEFKTGSDVDEAEGIIQSDVDEFVAAYKE
ncbi:MAG: hypothetical protein PHY31_10990 [Smithellaceae bacterium]|nr:hypothetical protein [Smithellaceae bacterium]